MSGGLSADKSGTDKDTEQHTTMTDFIRDHLKKTQRRDERKKQKLIRETEMDKRQLKIFP